MKERLIRNQTISIASELPEGALVKGFRCGTLDSMTPILPFSIEYESAPGIRLCQVDIQALTRDRFGDLALEDLRRPARNLSWQWPINQWLTAIELETVNRFKALKRQVEWLAGRLAVKTLVTRYIDPQRPPAAVAVAHETEGAPFLPDYPETCISITHAGRFAVAAISLDPHAALGIDIERLPIPSDDDFLGLVFSDRERAALNPADPPALARAWTLKEAYLKYIRQGFHHSLQRVEILDGLLLDGGRPAPIGWKTQTTPPDHLLTVVWGPHRQGR